jgi:hypothetical protein
MSLFQQQFIKDENRWLPVEWQGANWFDTPLSLQLSVQVFGKPNDLERAQFTIGDLVFNPAPHAYYAGQIIQINEHGVTIRWRKSEDNVFTVLEPWQHFIDYWWADPCDQPDSKIGRCACGGCPDWNITCSE